MLKNLGKRLGYLVGGIVVTAGGVGLCWLYFTSDAVWPKGSGAVLLVPLFGIGMVVAAFGTLDDGKRNGGKLEDKHPGGPAVPPPLPPLPPK